MKSIQIRIFTGVSNRLLKAKCKEKHRQYVRQSRKPSISSLSMHKFSPVHMPAGRECVAGHNVD